MGTPVRPPAAERRGPVFWDGIIALLVVLAAGTLFFLLRPQEGNFLTAAVVLDGEQIAEYQLSALTQPELLTLETVPYPITLEFAPGGVRILESACPGQDCVHAGWLRHSGGRIICLPNRLVISLTASGGGSDDFDAVTG